MLWCCECEMNHKPEHLCNSMNSRFPDCSNILSTSPCNKSQSQPHSILIKKDFYSRSNQLSLNFINNLALKLSIFDAFAVQQARKFYQTVCEREGECWNGDKRNDKIAGCCLYIACLLNKVQVLLFRVSIELGVNVYELGVEYLEICRILGFKLCSFVQNVVDPSLFIHRYVGCLLKERNLRVCMVALSIVECVKGDLMQGGRNVGGVCGAAVYVAALASGITCGKLDVERVVRDCDGALRGRLIEFGKRELGGVSVDEFRRIAKEFEEDKDVNLRDFGGDLDVLCRHKGEKACRYRLCSLCYKEFVEVFKGLSCGSNTQSFDRAKTETLIRECSNDKFGFLKKFSSVSSSGSDESEDLSDVEVDEYLGDDVEAEGKKVLWEVMNKEYIREQFLKKSAAAAGEKPRKKQMQKRGSKVDKATAPASTSAEATHQESSKKRLNSLINFDALNELFEDDEAPNGKKNRTESYHDTDAWDQEDVGEENIGGDSGNEDHEELENYASDCDFF